MAGLLDLANAYFDDGIDAIKACKVDWLKKYASSANCRVQVQTQSFVQIRSLQSSVEVIDRSRRMLVSCEDSDGLGS